MPREIKFRVWDKNRKQILYSDVEYCFHIKVNLNGSISLFDDEDGGKSGLWEHSVEGDDNFELMQYTGLHDKNGKEIYEGDIVRNDSGRTMKVVYFISQGIFSGFDLNVIDAKGHAPSMISGIWRDLEVIGNVYEGETCSG